ncbi:MAG: SpoIIE family protein phosphatase [Planctomycetota bacterium]
MATPPIPTDSKTTPAKPRASRAADGRGGSTGLPVTDGAKALSSTGRAVDEPVSSAPSSGLSLTDFLDLATLQDVQDSFTAVTRLDTSVLDAAGQPLTLPTDAVSRAASDSVLDQLITPEVEATDGRLTAPIVVEGRTLGSIRVQSRALEAGELDREAEARFASVLTRLGLDEEARAELSAAASAVYGAKTAASAQLLVLIANAIARLCYQQHTAEQRLDELSVLYKLSTILSTRGNLQAVLDTAARSAAEVMKVRATSIRLLEGRPPDQQLKLAASFGLSQGYRDKGDVMLAQSKLAQRALRGEMVYVGDMQHDDRVVFPQAAAEEGLASFVAAGMVANDQPIGTVQLFTEEPRVFTRSEQDLLRAIAQLLATAIENARLDAQRAASRDMVRQLHLAADVQRRMLPSRMPNLPGVEVAARYVPSLDLGGDFYDFIRLDYSLGLAIGDVVGKGVAASLLMASTRAALRAYAQDLYDLDEVISRVNTALCRDTRDNEFATLWYGTLDPLTMRLTYCNAGHEPPLLLRPGEPDPIPLDLGGMIVGVDPNTEYEKGIWDFEPGDLLLLYTDGLGDAMNGDDQRFGRDRIDEVLRECADKSAQDALNHILWQMRRHTGPRRGTDDTTLVTLRVK